MRAFVVFAAALVATIGNSLSAAANTLVDAQQAIPIYTTKTVEHACEQALSRARLDANKLAQLPLEEINTQTLLEPWDASAARIENILGPIYLQTYVHPNADVRLAGERCILEVTQFRTQLFQNQALYQALLALKPQQLNAPSRQLQQDLEHGFVSSGAALNAAKRQRAASISDQLERLAQAFQSSLREHSGFLELSAAEVEGMPSQWQQAHLQKNGRYKLSYDYPQYFPFMRKATNAEARKRVYLGFSRRGGPENLQRLDEIVALRQALAELHDVNNYAEFATRKRMLNSPARIADFLQQVATPVMAVEEEDIALLTRLKVAETGVAQAQLERWDVDYYLEQARFQRFAIAQEELRDFFPSAATVQWALHINEQLFGLRIVAATVPLWHQEVDYYDVYDADDNRYLGAIYLDLYPRDGKYKHAAAFPLRAGSRLLKQRPSSALVTNFNRQGLTQKELETLLHELGHVFHAILSDTWYASHSGTEVKRDFVEAPSQMLEAWARDYDSLRLIQNFCDSCPAINQALVTQLEAARTFGQGIFYARQHLYASFDMALATQAAPSAMKLWSQMETQSALGHLADSQFPGSFGHIAAGYAAGYYGYLWSEVLATDMQSLFAADLMNPKLGQHYRRSVLAKGGEQDPAILLKNFLGREPNSKAFFKQFKPARP